MEEHKIIDIAHIGFLDLIQALVNQSGLASAKGTLMRTAANAAEKIEPVDFPTFEDFVKAIDTLESPIATIEGKAVHLGDGVFGLPQCPFATSISNYKSVFTDLPGGYKELTEEYNRPGAATNRYHVGENAGVSPFCAVHQPLRSSLGSRITVGGKPLAIYQLGCKSGAGHKGLAKKWIDEAGFSEDLVSKVLDDHMCCYAVKVVE